MNEESGGYELLETKYDVIKHYRLKKPVYWIKFETYQVFTYSETYKIFLDSIADALLLEIITKQMNDGCIFFTMKGF